MLLSQKNRPHSAVLSGDTYVAQPQIFSSFALIAFPLSLDGYVTFLVPNYNLFMMKQNIDIYLFRRNIVYLF